MDTEDRIFNSSPTMDLALRQSSLRYDHVAAAIAAENGEPFSALDLERKEMYRRMAEAAAEALLHGER